MTNATAEKKESQKPETVQIGTVDADVQGTSSSKVSDDVEAHFANAEPTLIFAVRSLLRVYATRKSGAAIRDAVEMPHDIFGPREAVSAFSSLGFKASFGSLDSKNFTEDLLPLIAFKKNGEAVLIKSIDSDDGFIIVTEDEQKDTNIISKPDFKKNFSSFVILVKELNSREKEERSGHWFFSAFRKSKWLYVQVLIAAMVSNFLSLTVSLFTMTVYDRIIPNGAFESLIALSMGVMIALAFDFLIKSLRAKFIDTASKRADIEISRRLFDRILTLSPSEQRQKNWCYGWYNPRF
jgi:ATP-binding cassette subfamily C protein LapB